VAWRLFCHYGFGFVWRRARSSKRRHHHHCTPHASATASAPFVKRACCTIRANSCACRTVPAPVTQGDGDVFCCPSGDIKPLPPHTAPRPNEGSVVVVVGTRTCCRGGREQSARIDVFRAWQQQLQATSARWCERGHHLLTPPWPRSPRCLVLGRGR